MESMYLHFLKVRETHKPLALVTLLRTSGSTPQVPGASALISPEGIVAGTLGGGILEFDTMLKVRQALEEGKSMIFEYDLDSDILKEQGAGCGGKATVLIDVNPDKDIAAFEKLKLACRNYRPGAIITSGTFNTTGCALDERIWTEADLADDVLTGYLQERKRSIVQSIQNRMPVFIRSAEEPDAAAKVDSYRWIFIDPVNPPERLVIVGGGHVGRALIRQAVRLDFEVTVIDSRPDIIPENELPAGVKLLTGDIEAEIKKFRINPDTYIVIAPPGHQFDTEALKACIRSDAAYIGLMGSRRKLKSMRERFIDEGWATGTEFDAVHAPIGINIHAETVEEIAVSIAAELIRVRRKRHERYKKPHICNMILAAGESRRMKQQKLLMDYHGESIIKTVVRKSLATEADETLIVLGSHSGEIQEEISEFPVNTVFNPNYKEGMLSSIQSGFRAIPKKVNAVVLMLGDQPMIGSGVVNELIEMYRKSRAGLIIPIYRGNRGHPVLIDSRFRDEIFSLDPQKGLRSLMHAHPEDIREIEVDNPNILRDIDNVEDYKIEIT